MSTFLEQQMLTFPQFGERLRQKMIQKLKVKMEMMLTEIHAGRRILTLKYAFVEKIKEKEKFEKSFVIN